MLTRKDFIKKANEYIEKIKDKTKHTDFNKVYDIANYCDIAKKSNSKFDEKRFRDYIEKGLYNE